MFSLKYRHFAVIVSVFILCFNSVAFSADNAVSSNVNVSIESYDKTLASGNVSAVTFIEAIEKLGKQTGTSIVIGRNSTSSEVYSVNGIGNKKFKTNDGWYGYVIRNGSILKESDFLNTPLNSGDNVILYYGSKNDTKIINELKEDITQNKITLTASTNYVQWSTNNGKLVSENITDNIKTIRIHMKTPDGFEQVTNTDANGKAVFTADKTGYYTYYAECYNEGSTPSIVKTKTKSILIGITNKNAVTRGEFAALVVNNRNIKSGKESVSFSDIKNYKNEDEIKSAVSAGFISGYSDGTFRPDSKINMLEATVILSRFYTANKTYTDKPEGVPDWAVQSIGLAKDKGILKGINLKFNSDVSIDVLEKMLNNMK